MMERLPSLKIDVFCHILPSKYRAALYRKAVGGLYLEADDNLETHHNTIPALFDLDLRFSIMDNYEGLGQVLTISAPPLESVTRPEDAADLARLANDELAELVTKYPDRFVAGVACLPMNNVDAALKEAERAIKELGLKGVQLYTPCGGKPLDSPEFMPLYGLMAEYDLPVWLHPIRGRDTPDYRDEDYSRYRIFHIFGWPYETTAAMARLVFSGLFDKYPDLKFITHHCGGMVPYFARRLAGQSQRMFDQTYSETSISLSRPPIEYFKLFYGDTAVGGWTPALMCGHAFFGAEHILFGTDMPHGGTANVEQTISSIEQMAVPDADKRQIFADNARRLLHI